MFSDVLFFALWSGLAVFMVNRLYVGLRHGEIDVMGWLYSRSSTPVQFWLTISFAGLGLAASAFMIVALFVPQN